MLLTPVITLENWHVVENLANPGLYQRYSHRTLMRAAEIGKQELVNRITMLSLPKDLRGAMVRNIWYYINYQEEQILLYMDMPDMTHYSIEDRREIGQLLDDKMYEALSVAVALQVREIQKLPLRIIHNRMGV